MFFHTQNDSKNLDQSYKMDPNLGIVLELKTISYSRLTQDHGPVVQSILSLTSSLRGQLVKCFTTL